MIDIQYFFLSKIMSVTPVLVQQSSLATPVTLTPIDIAALDDQFKNGGKSITTSRFRHEGERLTIILGGQIFTNGINFREFDDGSKAYSIGIEISRDVVESLSEYEKAVVEFAPEDFVFEPLVKMDDHLFLKLKLDGSGKHFAFKSNLKITPKNYSEVSMSSKVIVVAEVSAYFNFKSRKMGIYFAVKDTIFE